MSGTNQPIEITIDDAEIRRVLQKLLGATTDLKPAFREIGEVLTQSTHQRFKYSKTPDGKTWAPNAKSTLANPISLHI